jgi:hypothetical protein
LAPNEIYEAHNLSGPYRRLRTGDTSEKTNEKIFLLVLFIFLVGYILILKRQFFQLDRIGVLNSAINKLSIYLA